MQTLNKVKCTYTPKLPLYFYILTYIINKWGLRFLLELVCKPLVRRASCLKYMKPKPPLLSASYSSLWASRPPIPSTIIIPCVSILFSPGSWQSGKTYFCMLYCQNLFFFFASPFLRDKAERLVESTLLYCSVVLAERSLEHHRLCETSNE